MPYHPRIECENLTNFTTIRTRNCELWFRQNAAFEREVLGNLAKCSERYGITLYAFAIEGNHKHELAGFPVGLRAHFFRDFNGSVTRSLKRHEPTYPGGGLWARRYSNEFVPQDNDIEKQFFYTVLQPVQDGICRTIDRYRGYNCFYDAVHGIEREYEVVDWTRYNSDKRWKKNIDKRDYVTLYTLKYTRLPGYEELSQDDYAALMTKKLREKEALLVQERKAQGKGFLEDRKNLVIPPGTRAKNPKISSRWSFRPRILCSCSKTARMMMKWYFEMLDEHCKASYSYRVEGNKSATFPPGMFRPPDFTCGSPTFSIRHTVKS